VLGADDLEDAGLELGLVPAELGQSIGGDGQKRPPKPRPWPRYA
jgi:hypothetical protein